MENEMATKESTATDLDAEMAAIRKDLAALRDDIAAIARTAVQGASNGTAQIGKTVRHKADEIVEKGSEIASSVGRHIEERPLAAVAVAFGAGFLLGKLMERRDTHSAPANGKHHG
jgi:ElaB/YqjD/DUF883 family membrane-anchored ribosome-binding protein